MQHFAEKLKKARKAAGLSQEKVAQILNISQSNISKYENGALEPSLDTIYELIDLYDINANFLFNKNELNEIREDE